MGSFFSSLTCHDDSTVQIAQVTDADISVPTLEKQKGELQHKKEELQTHIEPHDEVATVLVKEREYDHALLVLKSKRLSQIHMAQVEDILLKIQELLHDDTLRKQASRMNAVLRDGNNLVTLLEHQVLTMDVRLLLDNTVDSKSFQRELEMFLHQSLEAVDDNEAEVQLVMLQSEFPDVEGANTQALVVNTEAGSLIRAAKDGAGTALSICCIQDVKVEVDGTPKNEIC